MTAAALKLGPQFLREIEHHAFRGLMTAAALKPDYWSALAVAQMLHLPRSDDRGRIEAPPAFFFAIVRSSAFRGLMTAAALKRWRRRDLRRLQKPSAV